MPYLIKNDFPKVITAANLDSLVNNDDTIWQSAEVSAVEEIKSYLRNRYDVAAEFDFIPYVAADGYNSGAQVIVQTGTDPAQGHYTALQDVPPSTPITNATFWRKEDNRNQKLVITAIILVLYQNYTRINGTDIPAWLSLRHNGGDVREMGGEMGYLKMIQKGTVQPDLPLRAEVADGTDQSGNNIAYGFDSEVRESNTAI